MFSKWLVCPLLLLGCAVAPPPDFTLAEIEGLEGDPLAMADALDDALERMHRAGRHQGAIALGERALELRQAALEPDDPAILDAISNLAELYRGAGDWARAEEWNHRALEMRERVLGPMHVDVATTRNNLAVLYHTQGKFAEAEPHYRHAIEIRERALGPSDPWLASALANLAELYRSTDDARAEDLYLRAKQIQETELGSGHPAVANTLNNLAGYYQAQGEAERARSLHERALAIRVQTLGPRHKSVAYSASNLANTVQSLGDWERASLLREDALDILEAMHEPDAGLSAAGVLDNQAELLRARGEYARADALYERGLRIRLDLLGAAHPEVSDLHSRRAALYWSMGDPTRALEQLRAAADSEAALIAHLDDPRVSPLRPELLARQRRTTELIAAFHSASGHDSSEAVRLALRTVLRRKGRWMEPGARLEPGARPGERLDPYVVTVDAVAAALPRNAVLLELLRFRAFDPRRAFDLRTPAERFGSARYAAYLLYPDARVAWRDLGPAEPIDTAAEALRQSLSQPGHAQARSHAERLDALVLRPLDPLIGDAERIFVSPDGSLGSIPFGALVDTRGRYRLVSHEFVYLISGRSLLGMNAPLPQSSRALVLGAPDFNTPSGGDAGRATLPGRYFEPLSGAAREIRAVADLLGVEARLGERANRRALERVHSPRILHVATRGYSLDVLADVDGATRVAAGAADRLRRSGLALAGANLEGRGDGTLSALEVSGMDLVGTELAVFSSVKPPSGAGTTELRRALARAGSRSQLLNLWTSADDAHLALLESYYRRLLAGESRAGALRHVQLEMLHEPKTASPHYWAGFVTSGDWRPLQGKRRSAPAPDPTP